jgi:hypothetical protein
MLLSSLFRWLCLSLYTPLFTHTHTYTHTHTSSSHSSLSLLAKLSALERQDTTTAVISGRKYRTLFEAARGSEKSPSTEVRRRFELEQFVSSVDKVRRCTCWCMCVCDCLTIGSFYAYSHSFRCMGYLWSLICCWCNVWVYYFFPRSSLHKFKDSLLRYCTLAGNTRENSLPGRLQWASFTHTHTHTHTHTPHVTHTLRTYVRTCMCMRTFFFLPITYELLFPTLLHCLS